MRHRQDRTQVVDHRLKAASLQPSLGLLVDRLPRRKPAACYAGCYIRVGDVDAIHAAMKVAALPERGIPRLDSVGDKHWGMREFAIVDESGNLLRIGQVIASG
ncbi:bleomycin resistance protein [Xanthomonas oryzae pv. oryzae]|nr:bleomycin resistance protein [Xanthomonas oryzae pv. oryzae]OLI92302.1 bleomycin resistance protein [Xanthomonas oryzae pv. oryzae]